MVRLYLIVLVNLCFCVLIGFCLFVSTSAVDYLERLISEMLCYVLSETLNSVHYSLFVYVVCGIRPVNIPQ